MTLAYATINNDANLLITLTLGVVDDIMEEDGKEDNSLVCDAPRDVGKLRQHIMYVIESVVVPLSLRVVRNNREIEIISVVGGQLLRQTNPN